MAAPSALHASPPAIAVRWQASARRRGRYRRTFLAFLLQYPRRDDAYAFAVCRRHLFRGIANALDVLAVFLDESGGCDIYFAGCEQGGLALDHNRIGTIVGVVNNQQNVGVMLDVVELLIFGSAENQERVAIPEEPDGDRVWASIGPHAGQPGDDVLAQPPIDMRVSLAGQV